MRWSNGLARPEALALGLILGLAALPAAGDVAYVTNQNSEEVSILDLRAGMERARISVPGKPAGVVAGAGGFFTVSPDSKIVRRFDARGTETGRVQLDGGPIGIAHDGRRGRLFVSDWYNARLWVIDAESLAVTGTLRTGATPAGLAISPDGRWLVSADKDDDRVSVFDLDTLAPARAVTVGIRPFGLGFAPDGRLFVGNVGSNDVSVLDPARGRVLATVPVGERPYGVAFARGRAFVTNQYADTVSVIELSTLAPLAEIAVGEYPEGIDATADGATIVVANWFSNTVSLIDSERMVVTGEIATGDGPRAFGRFIAQDGE